MQLPFIDEHSVDVEAPPERTWEAVVRLAPRIGFPLRDEQPPQRLALEGRHPFSRYALVFCVDDLGDGTSRLRAQSWAAFPGPHGRVYRALVIGTRGHVLAVRAMLARMAREARP